MEIDVKHLEALAKVHLSADEEKVMEKDLRSILEHVKRLFELDVNDVPPTFGSGEIFGVDLDEDIPREGLKRDLILVSAPSTHDVFFKVPRESGAS